MLAQCDKIHSVLDAQTTNTLLFAGPVVQVPEDAAADHEHEVVHHGQVDNEQPVVVVVLDRDKDTLWR